MRRHRTREYKGLYGQGRRLPPMGLESVEILGSYTPALGTSTYPPQKCFGASAALPCWTSPQLCLPTAGLLAQGQYDLDPLPPFPDHVQYTHYSDQIGKRLVRPQASPPALLPGSAWLSQGSGGVVGRWESRGMVPCSVVTWGWGLA